MELLWELQTATQQHDTDTMKTYTVFLQTIVQRSEPWSHDSEDVRVALYGIARAALLSSVRKLIGDPLDLREVSRPGMDVIPCFEMVVADEFESERIHLYSMQLGKGVLYDSLHDPAWAGLDDITRVWVDLKDIMEGTAASNDILRPRTYCLVE